METETDRMPFPEWLDYDLNVHPINIIVPTKGTMRSMVLGEARVIRAASMLKYASEVDVAIECHCYVTLALLRNVQVLEHQYPVMLTVYPGYENNEVSTKLDDLLKKI